MHIHHPIATPFTAPSATASAAATKANASSSSSPSDSSSSDSSTSTATITANDFLELLVTEMKNQDPTADTDPNEYINQLVQVNSLEQLIQINQDLSGVGSTTGSSGDSASTSQGNLSANISNHSNIAAAASQVANAMETKPDVPVGSAASELFNRLPSNFLQGVNLQ
jgi:flagellar basal-body rod modification protein FlgD